MDKYNSRVRAFTLIELLVVIAVIAILATILIPAIAAVRMSARKAESVTNLRDITSAIQLYIADNSGRLPHSWIGGNSEYERDETNWREQLANAGYLGDPDYSVSNNFNGAQNYSVIGSPVQRSLAPELTFDFDPPRLATYVMNARVGSWTGE
ncbi:type II secretion system protein [Coraliomargarita sp. SDUM461004]|uniref:Type II secretion system protein n=1 Tax=Thalassobacterium sedimentorum TaxID=3041258 RepID=A0ABU1AND8_9BACT|nr:type II secretion system protein [Coraliomargarita sp. SDUM461004]MDQ8196189.1 type II secretion system protein [Coraliomargarita sp. SDUM461004]